MGKYFFSSHHLLSTRFLKVFMLEIVFLFFTVGLFPSCNQQNEQPKTLASASVQASESPLIESVEEKEAAVNLSDAIERVAENTIPAVVHIEVTEYQEITNLMLPFEDDPFFRYFFGFPKEPRKFKRELKGLGTGMIMDSQGNILTNNHVAGGASKIQVLLANGKQYPAKLVGADPKTDLAVIRISAKGPLPHITFGDSDKVKVGEWVVAIGHPRGLDQTVTQGIISAKHRTGIMDPSTYQDFLQTDAAINPGNSGGPLINLDGEVIGISNSIQTAGVQANLGIGFAIPSNMAEFIVDSLLKNGRVIRGWLGVEIETLHNANPDEWGTPQGALVLKVRPNTPAERAGVEKGDVIVGFNHMKVTSGNHLQNLVTQTHVGTSVVLVVLRDKRELPLNVTIEEYPRYLLPGTKEQEETLLGFTTEELSSENRQRYGYGAEARGMVITKVVPNSRAERTGLKPGDLILEINDPVPDFQRYMARIDDLSKLARDRKEITVLLLVDRAGKTGEFPRYFSLKIRHPEM